MAGLTTSSIEHMRQQTGATKLPPMNHILNFDPKESYPRKVKGELEEAKQEKDIFACRQLHVAQHNVKAISRKSWKEQLGYFGMCMIMISGQ